MKAPGESDQDAFDTLAERLQQVFGCEHCTANIIDDVTTSMEIYLDLPLEVAAYGHELAGRYREAADARAHSGVTTPAYRRGWDVAFGRN